ncbi:hypothetical protein ACRALDRAFT_2061376 [Sodiomyces alcalophilus JCM 7366]|uniref:uncharacterized protein n=1 Tax=Sodiomyces alcalophilus JCM 7366 TaxID=591952 RepID=UPI0039B67965
MASGDGLVDVATLSGLLRKFDTGIRIDDSALKAALDDPTHGPAFKEWASLHLGPDNLLSQGELALYSSLDQSGEVDQLVASEDLTVVPAVTEEELRTAIEELDRSTASITRQTETLKQHHNALAKLIDGDAKAADTRARLAEKRAAKQDAERKRLVTTVEDLSRELSFRVTDLEHQSKAADDDLSRIVDELLHSDDKLLSSLQKLGWELDPEDPKETQNVERLREICMRLIKSVVETTRTKLDRLYLEALHTAPRHGDASAEDVKALQEEVESLYAEILPVAQMSTEQQYLEPALKSVSAKNGQSINRMAVAVVYINACLDHLLGRLDSLSPHISTLRSHQAAVSDLADLIKTHLAVPSVSPSKTAPPPQPESPIRVRRDAASKSSWDRRSSGLPEESPLEALFRMLAIDVAPSSASSSSQRLGPAASDWDAIPILARTLAEREAKADDVALNAQESFEQATAAHLADARRAVQLLRDSVLAESPFGPDVKLVDPDIEGSITVLGQEVAKVQARVDEIQSARSPAGRKNWAQSGKQREMVERWGL